MKKLAIGQQDFPNLIHKDCIYVDKTKCIYELMESGGSTFFLSRPRRFGKSLLLSTLKAAFEGKRDLFKGLYIEDKIDWEPHPVIMLDMSKDASSSEVLKLGLSLSLKTEAAFHQVDLGLYEDAPAAMLSQLIALLYLKTGRQVVVLIDEYDKPVLDQMHDLDNANEIRKVLQGFYGVLKASSAHLKFLMVTGITKVSQTSIFSGFNNLNDISFKEQYAGICGYTQTELEHDFASHIDALAKHNEASKEDTLVEIKHWYNGYSWDAKTFVYNPYSVLLLLDKLRFNPHWYSTGTPTFLLKLLKTGDNLETVMQDKIEVFETFTDGQALENLGTIALLFQSGYLTIKGFNKKEQFYELQIPNEEVRRAISELVLLITRPCSSWP